MAWIAATAGPLLLLWSLSSSRAVLGIGAIVALAVLIAAAAFTARHHDWLLCALVLIEVLSAGNFIPLDQEARPAVRYLLLIVFCIPIVPQIWRRRRILTRGGFRDYALYFGWGLASVTYSLVPITSLGRVAVSFTLFCCLALMVVEIDCQEDLDRLLHRYLVGCAVVVSVLALSALVLPSETTWMPDMLGIVRFQGIFDTPNQVGEVMLSLMGTGLAFWPRASRLTRVWLAAAMIASVVMAAMADSRSPFVAVGVGVVAFAVWKWRWRGALACAAALVLLVAAGSRLGRSIGAYINRGDVTTLTGRSEAWRFSIDKLRESPLLGYGYEVQGEIFQSRTFPSWDEVWNLGPRSSVHNNYLSRAVGLGIPSLLFWMFFYFRPWLTLFVRRSDPWALKPLALLGVLPVMVLSLDESGAGDCRYSIGLLMVFGWMLAERLRLETAARRTAEAEMARRNLPAAVAAIAAQI